MKAMPWAAVVLVLLGLVGLWILAGILQSHSQNADVAQVASQALPDGTHMALTETPESKAEEPSDGF
jgi:hypothetical protein